MSLIDFFRTSRPNTASIAKERLQILVAHEHSQRNTPSYLPMMQKELLEVISKYVDINPDDISVTLEQNENEEFLELNITLPDAPAVERKKA